VRYMFEITPDEQHRLTGMSASMMKQSTENRSSPKPRATLVGMLMKAH